MEVPELERLIAIVQNANIGELTLREGDSRITIRKNRDAAAVVGTALIAYDDQSQYTGRAEASEYSGGSEAGEESSDDIAVHAHLVGVFHHVKPLVGLGARVTAGQVIGIIEAMKLINEVTAPVDGLIVDLAIEDGMPVEYGQALFAIHPEA